MRPGRDCPENFHSRRDKFQNLVRDRDETESLATFSLETETETETLVLHWFELSLTKQQQYPPIHSYLKCHGLAQVTVLYIIHDVSVCVCNKFLGDAL